MLVRVLLVSAALLSAVLADDSLSCRSFELVALGGSPVVRLASLKEAELTNVVSWVSPSTTVESTFQ